MEPITGVFVTKKENAKKIEVRFGNTWRELNCEDFNFILESWCTFFISNPNNLPRDITNAPFQGVIILGFYVIWEEHLPFTIYVCIDEPGYGEMWHAQEIFYSNFINHLCDFILHF